SDLRDIERPVHFRLVGARHAMNARVDNSKSTSNEVTCSERLNAARAPNGDRTGESEFQGRKETYAEFLAVHKRPRNSGMSPQTPKKLVHSNGSHTFEKTRQAKRFLVHQPHHVD